MITLRSLGPSSLWPVFPRSDSWNPAHRVRPWIRSLSTYLPMADFLAALTGIVTPLGLDEELVSIAGRPSTFQYAKYTSPYASGTSPRGGADFNRNCLPGACPYTGYVVERTGFPNGYILWNFPNSLTSGIPDVLRDIFKWHSTRSRVGRVSKTTALYLLAR